MKSLIALTVAAFAALPLPVHSGTIMPWTYATRYCTLRRIGADQASARAAAIREAYITADTWIWITRNGQAIQSDVVEAAEAQVSLCPGL